GIEIFSSPDKRHVMRTKLAGGNRRRWQGRERRRLSPRTGPRGKTATLATRALRNLLSPAHDLFRFTKCFDRFFLLAGLFVEDRQPLPRIAEIRVEFHRLCTRLNCFRVLAVFHARLSARECLFGQFPLLAGGKFALRLRRGLFFVGDGPRRFWRRWPTIKFRFPGERHFDRCPGRRMHAGAKCKDEREDERCGQSRNCELHERCCCSHNTHAALASEKFSPPRHSPAGALFVRLQWEDATLPNRLPSRVLCSAKSTCSS